MRTEKTCAPNVGNKALEQDFATMRELVRAAPLTWFAVRTEKQAEERAAMEMRAVGLPVYLPMVPDLRKAGKVKRNVDCSRPMFSRYVFAGVHDPEFSTALIRACRSVETILSGREDGAPHRIPAQQIVPIVDAAQKAQIGMKNVVGQAFEIGDRVVIFAGEANSFDGTIKDIDQHKGTARVSLKMFNAEQTVRTTLDKIQLS